MLKMTQSLILDAFEELISLDPELSGRGRPLLGEGMALINGSCEFTLESLFNWGDHAETMSFKEFRSQLYKSDLNTCLHKLGYIVVMGASTAKVNTSVYKLTKL